MVKETRKRWLRKESSVHMLRPFLAAPLAGTLGVSWHWQVSRNINPWWDSPFGGYPQSLQDTVKLQSRAQCSLHAGRIIHSHKHTIELVKQKTCLLRKQRDSSQCSYFGLKIPDQPPRWWLTVNSVGFMISEEEDLASGPGTRLDHSRAFV